MASQIATSHWLWMFLNPIYKFMYDLPLFCNYLGVFARRGQLRVCSMQLALFLTKSASGKGSLCSTKGGYVGSSRDPPDWGTNDQEQHAVRLNSVVHLQTARCLWYPICFSAFSYQISDWTSAAQSEKKPPNPPFSLHGGAWIFRDSS
jgi:hypothetical protein